MSRRDDDWRRLILSHEASGLSRAEFCRRRGVNYQTMSSWVRRFEKAGGQPVATRRTEAGDGGCSAATKQTEAGDTRASFVEVSLPAATDPRSYEVVLGSHRLIRLGADFDDEVLTRLIRTVESC